MDETQVILVKSLSCLADVAQQIDKYLAREFVLPISQRAQLSLQWYTLDVMSDLNYGQTSNYKSLAADAKSAALRASVANHNANTSLPGHRGLAGSIHETKRMLLGIEGSL